jgi:hypothetical protein
MLDQTRHPEHESTEIFVWRADMRIDRLTVQNSKNSQGRPSNKHLPAETKANGAARRWVTFYGCFNERIRFGVLRKWFYRKTTAAGNRGGRMRIGFAAKCGVRR